MGTVVAEISMTLDGFMAGPLLHTPSIAEVAICGVRSLPSPLADWNRRFLREEV